MGTALVLRYAWLVDDAYVYFRYVDNLVLYDRGLVYNSGEFVEGFSSPLWCLVLIAFRQLGFDFWFVTLLISVLSFWIFAFLLIDSNRLLGGDQVGRAINFPLIHLSSCYGVLCYFSSGLETPLVQIVAIAFACLLLRPRSTPLQLIVGLAPMLRHELALPWLVMLAWIYWRERRVPWPMVATCALSLGGWLVFRVYYYADFFPNTFYLKDEILIAQGLAYLYDTVAPYFSVQILLLFWLLHSFLARSKGLRTLAGRPRTVMLLMAALVALYVVKIGGDARHYRYFAFSYALAMAATGGLLEGLVSKIRPALVGRVVFPVGVLLMAFGLMCFPRQLLLHPLALDQQSGKVFHRQVMGINDSFVYRRKPFWTPENYSRSVGPAVDNVPALPDREAETVNDTWDCTAAYRAPHDYIVHNFGLTEPFLARVDAPSDRAAHKYALLPLAKWIASLRRTYPRRAGAFQMATQSPTCPDWIKANLASLNAIERKVYNQHDFFANLELALSAIPRIQLEPESGSPLLENSDRSLPP